MTCGTATRVVSKGAFAFWPRNCIHGFGIAEDSGPMHFATMNSSAGTRMTSPGIRAGETQP